MEPKRITILCLGTRGDVQPYVALALGLQRSGWIPKLCAPVNLRGFVEQYGVECHPFDVDTEEGLKSPEGQAWLSAGKKREFLRNLQKLLQRDRPALEKGFWEASQDADVLIGTVMTLGETMSLAEKLAIPFLGSLIFPTISSSREFANMFVKAAPFPVGALNRASHWLFDRQSWASARTDLNNWRSRLGLAALNRSPYRLIDEQNIPVLHHYSPSLFSRPTDWGTNHTVTGSLFLSDALHGSIPRPALDERLVRFLRTGPAPVFLGFGSMPILDSARVLRMTAEVTAKLNIRAVVGAGWSNFHNADLPPHIHMVSSVDHDQLFPLCRTLVHHGGVGTTHAGLRAGKAALVFSVFADQPFWGERLAAQGCGAHFPFRQFNEATLAEGLRRVLDPTVEQRARELGEQVRSDAGLERAVKEIDARLSRSTPAPALRVMRASAG